MLLPNYIKKRINKISKKVALSKKIYKPFPFYINNKKMDVEVFRIKNKEQLDYQVKGFKELQDKSIYLYLLSENIFENKLNSEIDLICCDENFKVTNIFLNLRKNSVIYLKNEMNFLWITKKGFVTFYEIKLNDSLSTSEIYISPKTF